MTTNIIHQRTRPPIAFRLLMKAINPFMTWLLRSPLHWIVSRDYMLITVMGCKTKRLYATPVQYKRIDDTLYVVTSGGYTWWKNLRKRAPVDVLLRGEERTGIAFANTKYDVVVEHMHNIYPNMNAQKMAHGKVAVTIELGDKAFVN